MVMLKSVKRDQICQICLDLHHLHTIFENFPGEDPQTPLPWLRLAALGKCGPPNFPLLKSGPSQKTVGHPWSRLRKIFIDYNYHFRSSIIFDYERESMLKTTLSYLMVFIITQEI